MILVVYVMMVVRGVMLLMMMIILHFVFLKAGAYSTSLYIYSSYYIQQLLYTVISILFLNVDLALLTYLLHLY